MSEQITEIDDPIARFLADGGKIHQAAYKESGLAEGTSANIWGRRKPGRPTVAESVDKPVDTE